MTTKKKAKKNPTGSRGVELCNQARALFNTIEGAVYELGEIASEMDEEAEQQDDKLLEEVFQAVDPVHSDLDNARNSSAVETSITKYLKART